MVTKTKSPDTNEETTSISDIVVAKTAGKAANEVDGVYSLGSGMTQAVGAVRKRVPGGTDEATGVRVEVGQRQTAIDLDLVVDYGRKIGDVVKATRSAVRSAVEQGTGLQVVSLNIAVRDVHTEDSSEESESHEHEHERQLL